MASLKLTIAVLAVASFGLAACTNPDGTTNNTGTGAVVGGTLGALFGRAVSGNKAKGTVIGGVVGAGVGAAIGNQIDKQEAALRNDLGGSGAQIIRQGDQLIVVLPEAITFDFDSAVVKKRFRPSIRQIAANLQDFPNNTVEVIGHTDNVGVASYNQQLSESRADAVADILISKGVPAWRVRSFGVGERQPIASNASAAGRQQNRRVEIIITPA
ncbi:MAG: OmpA family protein [Paracoccaceae bacterium]